MSYESVRRENSVNIIIVNLLDHIHRLCKGRCGLLVYDDFIC